MPEGAFVGDRIVEPEAVGIALRRLVDSAGAVSRDAVFGIASGSVITQVMNVPLVPETELQAVLEGELEHYKIMRHGESAFDYLRLSAAGQSQPSEEGQAGGETPMLLMAADKNVIALYQRVAELAGLNLVSLEPTLLGMYRVGWMLTKGQPDALCLSVDHVRSELAFIDAGAIRLYRRIDVGSENLFPTLFPNAAQNSTNAARPRASILGEEEEPGLALSGLNSGLPGISMNMSAARAVALEVRRSIEYYRREHPDRSDGDIVLVADTPAMETMQPWLQEELGRKVMLLKPGLLRDLNGVNLLQIPGSDSAESSELALLPALGLALGLLPDAPADVPRFNLTSAHRLNALAAAARRALLTSAAASLIVLLLGVTIAGLIHLRVGAAERELNRLQAEYATKQQQQNLIVSTWQRQQNQLTALQNKGFPFPRLMDAISNVVAPQAGLTEVDLDAGGRLSVTGTAVNDLAVVQTLDGMRSVNWFVFPTLDSQERKRDRQELPPHVEFKISTQLAAATTPPPAPKSGGTP